MIGPKDKFYHYCGCYLCNPVKKNSKRKHRMADLKEIKQQLDEQLAEVT